MQSYGLLPSHWARNWKQPTTGGWEAFLVSPGGIVTNEEVRKRTGQALPEKVIRERRLRWLGHVTRMDEVRIPKQAIQWEVPRFKSRPGRPRINWRDIVNKDIQRMGLTQDRQTWRQRVALCIGDAGWIKCKSSQVLVQVSWTWVSTLTDLLAVVHDCWYSVDVRWYWLLRLRSFFRENLAIHSSVSVVLVLFSRTHTHIYQTTWKRCVLLPLSSGGQIGHRSLCHQTDLGSHIGLSISRTHTNRHLSNYMKTDILNRQKVTWPLQRPLYRNVFMLWLELRLCSCSSCRCWTWDTCPFPYHSLDSQARK